MINSDYSKTFVHNGIIVNLPETTLFHPHISPVQVIDGFQSEAHYDNARIKRAIATERGEINWQALYGEVLT